MPSPIVDQPTAISMCEVASPVVRPSKRRGRFVQGERAKHTAEAHRLDPRNGIALNALHDRAFDQGLSTSYRMKPWRRRVRYGPPLALRRFPPRPLHHGGSCRQLQSIRRKPAEPADGSRRPEAGVFRVAPEGGVREAVNHVPTSKGAIRFLARVNKILTTSRDQPHRR